MHFTSPMYLQTLHYTDMALHVIGAARNYSWLEKTTPNGRKSIPKAESKLGFLGRGSKTFSPPG